MLYVSESLECDGNEAVYSFGENNIYYKKRAGPEARLSGWGFLITTYKEVSPNPFPSVDAKNRTD